MFHAVRRRRGTAFTLVELAVIFVILGLLAGIGIVAYSHVVATAQDKATAATEASLAGEAQALAAQRGDGTLTAADFTAAAADLPDPATPGTGAAGGWPISIGQYGYVSKPGKLHVRVAADGRTAGVAAVSGSGNCVLARVPVTGAAASWTVGAVGASCSGDTALASAPGAKVAYTDPDVAGPPAAPTGVSASSTPDGFGVSWAANDEPDVVGYRLVVDGVTQSANAVGTSATVAAAPGAHTVAVVAVDGTGLVSEPSAAVPVTVPPQPPAAVSVALAGTTATISWTPSAAATSYRVYRAVDGGAAGFLAQVAAPATSVSDPAAPAGAAVVYSVAAANAGGESAKSLSASETTIPPAVASVSATWAGATAPGTVPVTVSWTAAAGATEYEVSASTGATQVIAAPATSAAFTLAGSGPVTYIVTAKNSAGTSAGTSTTLTPDYTADVIADGPTLYYKFESWTATTAPDSSLNNHVGTRYTSQPTSCPNGTTAAMPTDSGVSYDATLGHSAWFAGNCNSWLRLPNGFSNLTSGFSYEFWARPHNMSGTWQRYLDLSNGPATNEVIIAQDGTTSNLAFVIRNGTNGAEASHVDAVGALQSGVWGHYVVTEDATGKVLIYRNGLIVGHATGQPLPDVVSRSQNWIGHSMFSTDATLDSVLDEVAFYPYTLTPTQVAEHYARR